MDPSTLEVAKQANELVRQLGEVARKREQREATLNRTVQAAKDKYGPVIEEAKLLETDLATQINELIMPSFALLAEKGTRTIKLRSGLISLRDSKQALEVSDSEATVIKRIAKHGGLRKFTRPGKRSLDKEALKKEPTFVDKIKGLAIVQATNLIIKPSRAQGEIITTPDPKTITVPEA